MMESFRRSCSRPQHAVSEARTKPPRLANALDLLKRFSDGTLVVCHAGDSPAFQHLDQDTAAEQRAAGSQLLGPSSCSTRLPAPGAGTTKHLSWEMKP
jgi:hypothetical protein